MIRPGRRAVALAATGFAATSVAVAVTATHSGAAAACAPAPAPVSAAPGATLTIPAGADTYVVQEQPVTGYGCAGKVAASNWTSWHSQAYLRFAVPAGQVSRATLTLTFERLDHRPAAVDFFPVTGAWSEQSTYANRPAVGPRLARVPVPAGATTLTVDVTAAVRAGVTAFGFSTPTGQSVTSVRSRESGAGGPALTVAYAGGTGTLCGASFTGERAGETYQQAFQREDALYGGLDLVRQFYGGLPGAWPLKLPALDRPVSVSFKALPKDVLAGRYDAQLRAWFAAAPRDRLTYWTYYHEPEDNIANGEFTAVDYRAAWTHLAGLADAAGNPRLRATLILMGWSLQPGSHRNWRDYYPGRATIDVLGWDQYNDGFKKGVYAPVAAVFGKVVETSRAEGLPFAVPETGTPLVGGDTGAARAAWLRAAVTYLTDAGAQYVSYFDLDWTASASADYRLRDSASSSAWRAFCTRS